jgi:hypothetical protein
VNLELFGGDIAPDVGVLAVVACHLCNIFSKTNPRPYSVRSLYLRDQAASVILFSRRRGAPEVVPFLGVRLISSRHARSGEGAKKLSGVPGDIPRRGEPAQHNGMPR